MIGTDNSHTNNVASLKRLLRDPPDKPEGNQDNMIKIHSSIMLLFNI